MCSRQHLRNKNKEDLKRVLVWYRPKDPPKVKSENFYNSRVLELENIMRTLVYEGFGAFIVAQG